MPDGQINMQHRIREAQAPLEICWDKLGIPHIFAQNVEDAFRGMGYACASERLWQLHLSNLYATGTAASVLGEKFVAQDLMHRAFNVVAYDIPDSPGDHLVDAYLQGLKQLCGLPRRGAARVPQSRHTATALHSP